MIELNDEQADKICEIVDIRFHHYEKAQYQHQESDINPMYYFYPKAVTRFAFKIDRVTGEFRMDEIIESLHDSSKQLFNLMKDLDGYSESDSLTEGMDRIKKHDELKVKVKEYLISENLLNGTLSQ